MPQRTPRSLADVGRDLKTLRSGKMPDASRAPAPKPAAAPSASPSYNLSDPVDVRRKALANKRDTARAMGRSRDVNLPAPRSPSRR